MGSQHRQVFLLASAQGLFQTASVMVMAVGGLAGAAIASDPQLATAPIASMLLGTAAAMAPVAWLTTRYGRRAAFLVGASIGVAGGLLAAFGIWLGSLVLLGFGTFLLGLYAGSAQFYRFAAAEVNPPEKRGAAISTSTYTTTINITVSITSRRMGRDRSDGRGR